jgi:uncharacterized protein
MLRLLLLALLAVIVYRLLRFGNVTGAGRSSTRSTEQIVACALCGVHVPESEAVKSDNQRFCSDQHRLSWTQSH